MNERPVIVLGGGMVGAALACALGRAGIPTVVVEATAHPRPDPSGPYDLRVCAISLASETFFRNLGAWQTMAALRVSPYRRMEVWEWGGQVSFDAADAGEPHLGHIIENRVVQWALAQRARELPTVRWIAPARACAVRWRDDRVTLELNTGETLEGSLVVGADGARSWLRQQADIPVRGWAYGQMGLVTTVRTALPHRQTAWQRFMPGGPLAFLPLADGSCSIVWSLPEVEAKRHLDTPDWAFRDALSRQVGARLGAVEWSSERAAFPLRLQHAQRYTGPRLALIGDAAHTIHPLAGQGVNLGLLDAAALAQVLTQAHTRGHDLGHPAHLRRYERWRKGDNWAMALSMDAFHRLFTPGHLPLRLARNLGLNLFDHTLTAKRRAIRHALGWRGEVPELARPIKMYS